MGGFAIKGWKKVRWENTGINISGNTAMAMGNYFFTTPDDDVVKVEYTFGYFLDSEGKVRINLHHSSVPYSPDSPGITEEQVVAAQKAWGDGIVHISDVHAKGGDYEEAAAEHIKTLYSYGVSPVLFKPTLAADAQFRSTYEEALSYFCATNGVHAEDTGFAIKGWKKVRWENTGINIPGNTAMAMGNYFFTTPEDDLVKVEYTFGYFLDSEGKVRLNLHHSSVPYSPASPGITEEQVLAAQKAWGDGIVHISDVHAKGGDYEKAAAEHIKTLYSYGVSPVLFKPTLAADAQF